ncbi:hypothetical protein CAEBREN_15101 [Caenorhabditis brenneri]|uniref:Sdz-33 F-box domain-containing protein n=1 Tax=Caenorhabditis brenneri TaxID=135651 RepID=G0NS20_CAEBE|nr:hypothetical protein CAEBREN_15101 [Caenorhabditis brenneri]
MGSYSFDVLEISEVPWITGNHLRKCFDNCKFIELSNTKLSAQELNDFLKYWIEGSGVQKFLLFANEPFLQMADILVGITSVSHPYVHDKAFVEIANPGYVIKNTEGLEAVIHLTDGAFYLTTDFEIVDENFIFEEISVDDEEEDSDGED